MDRAGQLSNVAFGGAWSEQIAGREALAEAIERLRHAAQRADEDDPRICPDVRAALNVATRQHPKGEMLRAAWLRSANLLDPATRVRELERVTNLFGEAFQGILPQRP